MDSPLSLAADAAAADALPTDAPVADAPVADAPVADAVAREQVLVRPSVRARVVVAAFAIAGLALAMSHGSIAKHIVCAMIGTIAAVLVLLMSRTSRYELEASATSIGTKWPSGGGIAIAWAEQPRTELAILPDDRVRVVVVAGDGRRVDVTLSADSPVVAIVRAHASVADASQIEKSP